MQVESSGTAYGKLKVASDNELMNELLAGHHDALAVLVNRYERLVFSVAQKILRDQGEAEEVVQTVFLELFQKVGLFDPAKGTLKVWLLQLAYTRTINRRHHLERRQFYTQVEVEDSIVPEVSVQRGSRRALTTGETARLVREALGTLEPRQKLAIELIAFEGLTFTELATRSGESVSNAKHHYYRGMAKIREFLSGTRQEQQRTAPAKKTELKIAGT